MLPVLFTRWNDLLPSFEEIHRVLQDGRAAGMALDVRQAKDGWVVEAEVPGFGKDDLTISIENGVLTISGATRQESTENQERYHLRERHAGQITRSVVLPESADAERVDAKLENGVLTLTIPVREEAKPRRIEVK